MNLLKRIVSSEGEKEIKMAGKFWPIIALTATVEIFCCLAWGEENNFIQPCADAGGYRSWLGGPNKNHLGHDYNAPAGTEVKTIADGVVWYVGLNISGFGSEGEPGPAIWIRHRLADGSYFYALYGHVEPASEIRNGYEVKAGRVIGTIITYLDKETKQDISHLHLGIWNSESEPPLSKMGYGPVRHFTDPIIFLRENKPYVSQIAAGRIIFVGSSLNGALSLWSMNPDGSGKIKILPEVLPTDENLYHLAISPDGKKLAFPKNGIIVMNIDGSGERELGTPFPQIHTIEGLRWSPDGTRIVFEGPRGVNIYAVRGDGTGLVRLVERGLRYKYESNWHPVWSSDGKKIMFKRHIKDREWELCLINADGRGEEQLVTGSDIVGNPELSPDGKRIAFYGLNAELHVGTLKDNNITAIRKLRQGRKALYKRWSPDGTRIVFSDGNKMCVISAAGNNLKEIYYGHNWLIGWVEDFTLK